MYKNEKNETLLKLFQEWREGGTKENDRGDEFNYNILEALCFTFFFFLVVLGFELRTSCLLGRRLYSCSTLPAL
jgi:hypothetical protein